MDPNLLLLPQNIPSATDIMAAPANPLSSPIIPANPIAPSSPTTAASLDMGNDPYASVPFTPPPQAPVEIGTLTQQVATPEVLAAKDNLNQAFDARSNALGATLGEQADLANQASALQASKANVIGDNEEVIRKSNAVYETQYRAAIDDYNTKRTEYESVTPKTFWAKADTGSKIGMALALIVGGAAGGGKQNLAYEAMNNAIAQDWAEQKEKLDRQLKGLETRKADANAVLDAKSRAANDMRAYQAASLAQIQAHLDSLMPKVQLAEHKEKIAQLKGELSTDQAKINLANEQSIAGQTQQKLYSTPGQIAQAAAVGSIPANAIPKTATPERQQAMANAFQTMQQISGGKWGDTVKDPTEVKGKSIAFLQKNEKNLQTLEDIEKTASPEELTALANAASQVQLLSKSKDVPIVGGAINTIAELGGTSPEAVYDRALPGGLGAKYFTALRNIVNDQTRYESGAAISPSEFAANFARYGVPTTGAQSLSSIVQDRRKLFESHRTIIGENARPLFFEKANKGK